LALAEVSILRPTATPWRVILSAYVNAALDSPHTKAAYRRDITVSLEGMAITSLDELTGAILAQYRADLMAGRLAPPSVARRLYALRGFLKWSGIFGAHQLDDRVINAALKVPRFTVQRPYILPSPDELARLWTVAGRRANTYALLSLCMGTGLRVSEIAHLRIKDLYADLEGGPVIHVDRGKGSKDRNVPMQPDYFRGVLLYLESTGRSLNSPGRVFIAEDRRTGPTSTGITSTGLAAMLRRMAKDAGIDHRLSVHSLRHFYAVTVLRHSHDLTSVQKLLGHSSPTVTAKYTDHLALADLRAALPDSSPCASPGGSHRP
jgi:site-specific recombinase XerD